MSEIVEIGESANGREVELPLHQTLRVTLPEVRTAGFRWNLRAPKERVCLLIKEDLESSAGGAGGSGKHHWEFRAEEAGTVDIVIEYRRPWERATAPARTFSLSIRVT